MYGGNNLNNIEGTNNPTKTLVEEMEIAAKHFRQQLGYNEDVLAISFEDLIKRLRQINHLIIKQYDSPIRPMSTRTEDGYMIVIGEIIDERTGKEQLLHEIAHILFDNNLPQFDGGPVEYSEMRADVFARCFLMPKYLFLTAFIENSNSDELVNINGIASRFEVNDYLVMKRGEELLGWK